MARTHRLTAQEIDWAVLQYRDGLQSIHDLAGALLVKPDTVRKRLLERGVVLGLSKSSTESPPSLSARTNANDTLKRHRNRCGVPVQCAVCGWVPPKRFFTMIHVHHVLPVAAGGQNEEENMVLLCPNHHSLAHVMFPVHRGQYSGPLEKSLLIEALADPDAYYDRARDKIRSLLR